MEEEEKIIDSRYILFLYYIMKYKKRFFIDELNGLGKVMIAHYLIDAYQKVFIQELKIQTYEEPGVPSNELILDKGDAINEENEGEVIHSLIHTTKSIEIFYTPNIQIIENYFEQYFDEWKSGKLENGFREYEKRSIQLERVLGIITSRLRNKSKDICNLPLESKDKGIDYVGVILFLQYKKIIDIVAIISEGNISIKVLDRDLIKEKRDIRDFKLRIVDKNFQYRIYPFELIWKGEEYILDTKLQKDLLLKALLEMTYYNRKEGIFFDINTIHHKIKEWKPTSKKPDGKEGFNKTYFRNRNKLFMDYIGMKEGGYGIVKPNKILTKTP